VAGTLSDSGWSEILGQSALAILARVLGSALDAPDRAVPGQKFVPVDIALIRLDLVHHPVQIIAGVDPVEARTFDQAVVDRPDFSCLVFADEKGVL